MDALLFSPDAILTICQINKHLKHDQISETSISPFNFVLWLKLINLSFVCTTNCSKLWVM